MHYIPIAKTIKSLYIHCSDYFVDTRHQCSGHLTDIKDGNAFKVNELFQNEANAFQIILYEDAFEVTNPLGSSKQKHKLVGMYFTLSNFKTHLRSSVDHIQLVSLCKDIHYKEMKEKVHEKLIKDLKIIETVGIEIQPGQTIKGTVICITADNLGAHSIGRFCENFSTVQNFCRYCLITKDEFDCNPCMYGEQRTVESYNNSLAAVHNDQNITHHMGVKDDSPFNSLKYYHVCGPGLPPCIAHDMFEGTIAYDLALFIKQCVIKGWFTYQQLNWTISNFKYQGSDGSDKPCLIKDKSVKLSGQAVQNWTLIRLLPLILDGFLKNPNDEVWYLFVKLKTITEIVCTPVLLHSQVAILKSCIEEYLELRHALFPGNALKPKHHFLSHYPEMILHFGPLVRLWTLRFESKHGYFKKCVRRFVNFRNVTKMLAEQHQLLQAYYSSGSLFKSGLQYDNCVEYCTETLSEGIVDCIRQEDTDVCQANSIMTYCINIDGTMYKKGMYVLLEKEDTDIIAGKIDVIIVKHPQLVYFVVTKYRCMAAPSLGLQIVQENALGKACVPQSKLIDFLPLYTYSFCNQPALSLKHTV